MGPFGYPKSMGVGNTLLERGRAMRRHTWICRTIFVVVFAAAACAAAAPGSAADHHVLQVFTVDDLDRPTDLSHAPVKVTPLYGGSDRTAVALQWQYDPSDATPSGMPDDGRPQAHPTRTVASVQFDAPADTGDLAITGLVQMTVDTFRGSYEIPGPLVSQPRVTVAVHGDGGPAVTAPWLNIGASPANDFRQFTAVRLPIPRGPARRVRVDLMVPDDVSGTLILADLCFVGSGSETAPTTPLLGGPSPAWPLGHVSASPVREFDGDDFDAHLSGSVNGVEISAPVQGSSAKQIANVTVSLPPAAGLRTIPLLAVDDPGVTRGQYAIVGDVSYGGVGDADVVGYGYLEMWSDFADGGHYFTRALGDSGLMRGIRGRSGPRPFALPFDAGDRRPTRISMNLVMSGRGGVGLTNLQLVQYDPAPPSTRPAVATNAPQPPWWARDRVTGTATGLFGLVGFLALAEPLMRRGRGRGTVLALVVAVGVLGEVYFGWAMAVAGHGEPWRTWTPLLLCGVAGLCVPACIPIVNRRYRDAELRRMRALDALAPA